MYIVPMEIPEYCNKCPFGRCNYTHPAWSAGSESRIDGRRNPSGTYGYTCGLDSGRSGKSTKVMRAGFGEDIPKPKWCGLKETGRKENSYGKRIQKQSIYRQTKLR